MPEAIPRPPPSRTPASIAFADDADSEAEKCGFVCHVLVVLVAITYTVWILQAHFISADGPPRWTRVAPAIAVCLFVASLALYYVINAFVVCANKLDALETIRDEFSPPSTVRVGAQSTAPHSDASTKKAVVSGNDENDNDEIVSHIFDLDVAEINDLVWERIQHRLSAGQVSRSETG
jgi:hypothetical protein